jgi:hypothetical protein
MTQPVLRAELENGDTYDDPSEDALFILFEDIEAGEQLFVIVEELADTTRQTYIQALRDKDGTYIVEWRAGTPESHQGTRVSDMREAHRLVADWASGR